MTAEPAASAAAAVIVAVPLPAAVTSPDAPTVATDVRLLGQVGGDIATGGYPYGARACRGCDSGAAVQ